jgi:DNA polymerase (family 10)
VYCTSEQAFPVALWRATGSGSHCSELEEVARGRGYSFAGDTLLSSDGRPVVLESEEHLYRTLGMAFIPPELRENRGEIAAALRGALPRLLEHRDIRGVLHCHSNYSDGTTSIEGMALAARDRGLEYLGVTDHSQSAFYAGGLSRDSIRLQHEEIDRVNERLEGFRVLKGIEADILADGSVDYEAAVLGSFDYVVASVHSRFAMGEAAMTERILRALEDPHVTVLGHPTGRLLLTREPYGLDVQAVIDRAAELGVAVELNCDPHRLDLEWRWLQVARERGATIEVGPDAHSPSGLDYMHLGVGVARKGWLEASDVLNTRGVDEVLEFARARSRRSAGVTGSATHDVD